MAVRSKDEADNLLVTAREHLEASRVSNGLQTAEGALAAFRALGHSKGVVESLELIIQARAAEGNPMAGLRAANTELEMVRRSGDKRGQAELLDMMAHTHAVLKEPLSALYYARQALELYWALDDKVGRGWALHTIAEMQRLQGEMQAATASANEALAAFREAGDEQGQAQAEQTLSALFVQRGTPELAPKRSEALRSIRELVKAVQDRSEDRVRAAEGKVNAMRELVKDEEVAGALQSLLVRDPGAAAFLRDLGWQIAGPEKRAERLPGTNLLQYGHRAFYLHTVLTGMNFGPQFRAVHPWRKGTPTVDGIENCTAMTTSQLPETEEWQMMTLYRHGIMDSGIQQSAVLGFPPH